MTDEIKTLLRALMDGKTLQYHSGRAWQDMGVASAFSWLESEARNPGRYASRLRVKPENIVRYCPVTGNPLGGIVVGTGRTTIEVARSAMSGNTLLGILRLELTTDGQLVSATMEAP